MRIEIPQLETNDDNINKAFRTAYSDIIASIWKHKDGLLKEEKEVILAGMGYCSPWTRDAAINVWNCGGVLFPEASKNTLLSVLSEDEYGVRVGGEYWDAIIWVTGAWYYYLYTGDVEFLEFAYKTSKTTLKYFEDTEFSEELNLFRGPACYGDGVAAYPDIYAEGGDSGIRNFVDVHPELCAEKGVGIPMHCLSTNCLYYNAENLKGAINKHFWLFDKGYYRYIVDDFGNCDYQEGMGQSFAILFGVADKEQVKKYLKISI